jgi:uncharacterized protein
LFWFLQVFDCNHNISEFGEAMEWLNEPPVWRFENGTLEVKTGNKTDFWRVTHYGFIRDDGHVYGQNVAGDCVASVRFSGDYQHLYDQAGLMLRIDEKNWLKTGIEFDEGKQKLSAVVTRDVSDWSVIPLEHAPNEVCLKLTRKGAAVKVEYSLEGQKYEMLRLAYFPEGKAMIGMMCCSPQREGFRATFKEFEVKNL